MTTELQFTLADIPVPMVYATHRIIRDCNSEFAALFGYRRDVVMDTSFSRLYAAISDFVRTGEMWRQFRASLEAHEGGADRTALGEGAILTFGALQAWRTH